MIFPTGKSIIWAIQNWLVVWNINFIFPYIGNNHPNWLIFFRGVQTTNQILFCKLLRLSMLWQCFPFASDHVYHAGTVYAGPDATSIAVAVECPQLIYACCARIGLDKSFALLFGLRFVKRSRELLIWSTAREWTAKVRPSKGVKTWNKTRLMPLHQLKSREKHRSKDLWVLFCQHLSIHFGQMFEQKIQSWTAAV